MITCYIKYTIDPYKSAEFETYAKMWIPLVNQFGGTHLGYYLPHEGSDNIALALFNFPSLASYEQYRSESMQDPACLKAYAYAVKTKCIISYERSFMRPILSS
ncbi:MAG: NIPSNAP family protein [Ekhidna sp.]|uniref:NIPSNAP family protein n=1 Tax=Ekhidna sp. TaxID=2608089 RepID=UPI0032EB405F